MIGQRVCGPIYRVVLRLDVNLFVGAVFQIYIQYYQYAARVTNQCADISPNDSLYPYCILLERARYTRERLHVGNMWFRGWM